MAFVPVWELERNVSAPFPSVPHVFPFPGPMTLPGGGVLNLPVVVFGVTRPIRKITLAIHVQHEQIGLVALSLESPDGTGAVLSAFNGGRSRSYGTSCAAPTVFDDEATREITQARPPLAGEYRPQDKLSVYASKPLDAVNGRWHLIVSDASQGDARARVVCAALTIWA
jgi:hypothetical protein